MAQQRQLTQREVAQRRSMLLLVLIVVLWLCVLASGLAVVYSTHLSRQLCAQLDQMQRETNELHMEWGQYLLERSTWSAFDRVENIASNRLNMHVPEHEHIVIVETSRK